MDPWAMAKGKGKGKGKAREGEERPGRTYRAPKPHAAATNEKNPAILTRVPIATYEAQHSAERAKIRKMLMEEVEELGEKSAKKRQLSKRSVHSSSSQEGSGRLARNSIGKSSGRLLNAHGNPISTTSPLDLLTGERDGQDGKAILVSPISYGRTASAARALRRRRGDGNPGPNTSREY